MEMNDKMAHGAKSIGVGGNRGGRKVTEMEINYYLSEDKPNTLPSVKLRQKSEQTRQRTAENRLFELHITGYPNALNGEAVYSARHHGASLDADVRKVRDSRPREDTSSDVKASGLVYPAMRSTNQLFNDFVQQARQRSSSPRKPTSGIFDNGDVASLPVHLQYAATYNRTWSAAEKADVQAARKLPYDSTLQSVVGRPKTVYREDYCKKAHTEDYRDQVIPEGHQSQITIDELNSNIAAAAALDDQQQQRPTTARVIPSAPSAPYVPTLRVVSVGSNDDDSNAVSAAGGSSSWISEFMGVSSHPKIVTCARNAAPLSARLPSPRRLVTQPSRPRVSQEFKNDGGTFVLLPKSYFTNRAKYTIE